MRVKEETSEVEAALVKVGPLIHVLVDGIEPFNFESVSYDWDLWMLMSWHKQETGSDSAPCSTGYTTFWRPCGTLSQ